MSQILVITRSLILLFTLVAAVSAPDNKITCKIPPVELSEDAVLTCNFPEDLSEGRKDFTIYHYIPRGSPDAVVDCWWLGGKIDCFVKSGFQYNKVVTRNLTVTVSQVKHEDAGTYACQVANYGPSSMETCELRVLARLFTTCQITLHQNPSSQASLTCFFNEDIGRSRRNFSVYKHNGQDKQRVMECQWKGERPECWLENGFLYDYEVSSNLTLRIPEVTKEKAGNYSCWHANSDSDQLETCFLDNEGAIKTRDQSFKTLAIGLPVGLTVLAALVAAAVVFLIKYKRKFLCWHRQSRKEQDGEEALPMLKESEPDDVTQRFQEHLVKEISAMYPNLSESSYFVPPVYFNRTRYRLQTVAGQHVYVPDPPDTSDVTHDRAMQHVIHCLRHMAESQEERMFVLTQFQYEDYLNSPDPAYLHHRLPMPAGLREVDSDVGCFDFLIVHRLHGLLVGVVKAVSDRDVESQDNELNGAHVIVQEVTQALKQLEKVKRMIQHLMSDQENVPNVRQTLIFPNLSRLSLRDAVKNQVSLVENTVDDPTDLCLCAEQLSDSNTPWDVSHTVVSNVLGCWKWNVNHSEDAIMTDELYRSVIARFCGPATQSSLRVPKDYEHFSLPKTLHEAVSVIGDLFARLVLSPDLIELLDEPRVVLSGPPHSGKTTLLSLARGKWLSSGHDVFVIKEKSSMTVSVLLKNIKAILKVKHDNEPSSEAKAGSVYENECSFRSRKSIENCIENMAKRKNSKICCALIDEAGLENQRITEFCDVLLKQIPDSRCWAICSNSGKSMETDNERHLNEILLSPPSVLRELTKLKVDSSRYVQAHETNTYPPSTDGPPVKHICHKLSGIWNSHSPQKCLECGHEVGSFLAKSLLIAEKGKAAEEAHTDEVKMENIMKGTLGNASARQTSRRSLQFRDILIVFEFTKFSALPDVKDDCNFLKGLRESGIMVRTVTGRNTDDLVDENSDVALAVHVRHTDSCRTKRKIVVYVESEFCADFADRRRHTLLSCTSQLIWVHPQKANTQRSSLLASHT